MASIINTTSLRMLFDAKIRRVTINGVDFTIGSMYTGVRSVARKANADHGPAKSSNVLFTLRDLLESKLKAGYVDKAGPYLLETEKYRALATAQLNQSGGVDKISVVTNADEAHLPQVFCNYLFMNALANNSLPMTFETIRSSNLLDLNNQQALGIFQDTFYYELKYTMGDVPVEFSISQEDVDAAFSKIEAVNPVCIPKGLEYINKNNMEIPCFATASNTNAAQPTTAIDAVADRYAKIKGGAYRKFEYRFPPDCQEFIPPLEYLEGYVPSKEFFDLLDLAYIQECEAFGEPYADKVPNMKALASEMNPANVLNVLLFGPPGTGKSTMPRAVAAALGIPFRNVTCSPENDENSFNLQIMFGENGEMRYFEQKFRVAYRQGGIIVCDEVNLARPDILQGVFSAALDDSYRIGNMRTDDDSVEGRGYANRAAATICCFTCNPGAAGTKLQNTAFYSRIANWIELAEITKEDLFAMVKCSFKDIETSVLDSVYKIYSEIRKGLGEQMDEMKEYQDLLSPRCFRYCIGQYVNGMLLSDAVKNTMLLSLTCLVQEKGEDTFEEFRNKILSPIEYKLTGAAYNKRRKLNLLV